MFEPQKRKVTRGSLQLEYTVYNPAATESIFLLHGFPQIVETWDPIARELRANFRVVVPTQLGYSQLACPRNWWRYRIPALADDVEAIARAEGIETFHVVGHDWGASVAWHLARERPQTIRTCVVASMPEPRALARSFIGAQILRSWYILPLQIPGVPELLVRSRGGWIAKKWLERTGLSAERAGIYVDGMRRSRELSSAPFRWYRAMLFNLSELASSHKVNVPIALVWGTKDEVVDRSGIDGSSRWAGAEFQLHELIDVSHWIPEDAPAQLASIILELVDRHADR